MEYFFKCIYGEIKFLYVSPERLKTEIFIERAKRMKVSLLAVDEAHCISQWGYDFRPPYIEIAEFIKEIKIEKLIAVTASATKEVKVDIQEKLDATEDSFGSRPFTIFFIFVGTIRPYYHILLDSSQRHYHSLLPL